MSLDILLEPIPDRNAPHSCKVGQIVASLTDPHKSALVKLLGTLYDDGGLSDEALTARMVQAGLQVGAKAVYRHRRHLCNCPEGAWA